MTSAIPFATTTLDLIDVFPNQRVEPGRAAAFVVLLSFLVSFGFIRTSARLMRSPKVPWWPGSVTTESGLHIHHMVWGIWLMIVCGFAAFATDLYAPWWWITAMGFGVGAGLTLDEFALWLHLDDVYWSDEGRSSVDAVIFAALAAGLVVIGLRPFGFDDSGSVIATVVIGAVNIPSAAITLLKGRLVWGALAIFIPIVGLVFIFRIAKPNSPWAHWFYEKRHPEKMEKARRRFGEHKRTARLGRLLDDAIGGRPTDELGDAAGTGPDDHGAGAGDAPRRAASPADAAADPNAPPVDVEGAAAGARSADDAAKTAPASATPGM